MPLGAILSGVGGFLNSTSARMDEEKERKRVAKAAERADKLRVYERVLEDENLNPMARELVMADWMKLQGVSKQDLEGRIIEQGRDELINDGAQYAEEKEAAELEATVRQAIAPRPMGGPVPSPQAVMGAPDPTMATPAPEAPPAPPPDPNIIQGAAETATRPGAAMESASDDPAVGMLSQAALPQGPPSAVPQQGPAGATGEGAAVGPEPLGGPDQPAGLDPEYVQRAQESRSGGRDNGDGTQSSVLMAQADSLAFPTLFPVYPPDPNVAPSDPSNWIDYGDDTEGALTEAQQRGELYEFASEEEARQFAEQLSGQMDQGGGGAQPRSVGGNVPDLEGDPQIAEALNSVIEDERKREAEAEEENFRRRYDNPHNPPTPRELELRQEIKNLATGTYAQGLFYDQEFLARMAEAKQDLGDLRATRLAGAKAHAQASGKRSGELGGQVPKPTLDFKGITIEGLRRVSPPMADFVDVQGFPPDTTFDFARDKDGNPGLKVNLPAPPKQHVIRDPRTGAVDVYTTQLGEETTSENVRTGEAPPPSAATLNRWDALGEKKEVYLEYINTLNVDWTEARQILGGRVVLLARDKMEYGKTVRQQFVWKKKDREAYDRTEAAALNSTPVFEAYATSRGFDNWADLEAQTGDPTELTAAEGIRSKLESVLIAAASKVGMKPSAAALIGLNQLSATAIAREFGEVGNLSEWERIVAGMVVPGELTTPAEAVFLRKTLRILRAAQKRAVINKNINQNTHKYNMDLDRIVKIEDYVETDLDRAQIKDGPDYKVLLPGEVSPRQRRAADLAPTKSRKSSMLDELKARIL